MHSEITDKYKNKDIVKKIRTEIEKEAQKKEEHLLLEAFEKDFIEKLKQ